MASSKKNYFKPTVAAVITAGFALSPTLSTAAMAQTNNDLVLAGCYEECQGGTMSLSACKKNLDDAKAKLDEAKANYQAKRDATGNASTDLESAQAAEKEAAANLEAAQAAYDEAAAANEAAQQHLKDVEGSGPRRAMRSRRPTARS